MDKIFTVETRYDRMVGSDYAVIIDEEGRETTYDLDDLKDIYGDKNIKIIIKEK